MVNCAVYGKAKDPDVVPKGVLLALSSAVNLIRLVYLVDGQIELQSGILERASRRLESH